MKSHIISLLVLLSTAIVFADLAKADADIEQQQLPTSLEDVHNVQESSESAAPVSRDKRTLFLKKKLLGVGAIGFGLGVGLGAIKGYELFHTRKLIFKLES